MHIRSSASLRPILQLALVLLIGLALRLPTFARPMVSDDEAIYATTADALRRGDVLYRDVVDHKPPAVYDVYLLGFLLLGPYNTQGAHALAICAVLLCAAAVWRASRRMSGREDIALTAAALWAVFSTTMFDYDALAANCELFVVCAQAVAFAWLVREAPGERTGLWTWLGVGVLTGTAFAFKYQGATFLAVVAAAALLEAPDGRRRPGRTALALAVAGLGCLVVPGAYAARSWHDGGLAAARYWFEFNFSYVAAGLSGWEAIGRFAWRGGLIIGLGALLPYAFGLAGAWNTIRDWAPGTERPTTPESALERRSRTLAVVWLFGSAIAMSAGGRFFGHYFHLVLPALSVLAAPALVRAWKTRPRWRPVILALGVGPALVTLAVNTVARDAVVVATSPEPPYERLARELGRISRPSDRVFVWGNSPQVYVLAQRPMGARFSFCNYMTGISPGTKTDTGEADPEVNALPAAWQMLFDDLDRRQPRWVVDASAGGWDGYGPYRIERYPRLDRYIGEHYRARERVDGVVLYERDGK